MIAKNLIIPILVGLLVGTIAEEAIAADSNEAIIESLLIDGFLLTGVDGKLTIPDTGIERWFFEFDSEVSDGRGGLIKAGESIELLPSATLEKVTAGKFEIPGQRQGLKYRLWGRVTRYKNENFIFPIYFLPLSKASSKIRNSSAEGRFVPDPALQGKIRNSHEAETLINEPEDTLTIPQEIIAKLKSRRIIQPTPPPLFTQTSAGQLKQDFILVDRTGFIIDDFQFPISNFQDVKAPEHKKVSRQRRATNNQQPATSGQKETERSQLAATLLFVLDGLGQDVSQISFELLPCQELERAQQAQSRAGEPIRFKIAGVVTKYKGKHYLLLQRAIPAYSYGNFVSKW